MQKSIRKRRSRITAPAVDRLKPGEIIWDGAVLGFGARCQGRATVYVAKGRLGGKQKWVTIGRADLMNLDAARAEAQAALAKMKKGQDPQAKKERSKPVSEIAEDFKAKHLSTRRTGDAMWNTFERHIIPAIGTSGIVEVRKADIVALIDAVAEEAGPHMAIKVRTIAHKFFGWCLGRDLVDLNPVAGTGKPIEEQARDRVLTDDEIRHLWAAAEDEELFGNFVRLLLVTAQRRNEVAAMMWSEIDEKRAVWTLPRERTKADREHVVPLSGLALDILGKVKRIKGCDYVFSGNGETPISGFSRMKARLDETMVALIAPKLDDEERLEQRAKLLPPWRLHDLRRTAATGMARLGVSRETIALTLNHAQQGVTAIYDRHPRLEERRRALAQWAETLQGIIDPSRKVVPLRRAS